MLVRNGAVDDVHHDFVDKEVIWGDFTRDNHLTQAPAGVDNNLGLVTVAGVNGHGHTGSARVDHLLNGNSH